MMLYIILLTADPIILFVITQVHYLAYGLL